MKSHQLLKEETNSTVYKKIRKFDLERTGKINCAHCPYHRGENREYRKDHRNWKKFRKTQYKPVVYNYEDEKQIT